MTQDINKPNGQTSFLETLSMMSIEIGSRDLNMTQVNYVDDVIIWAEEFEQIHEGRIWDGEWEDSIREFIDEKLSDL